MRNKITEMIREHVFILSIITTIIGLIAFLPGLTYYTVQLSLIFEDDWNFYLLIIGLVVFGIGISYLYGYIKNKRFIIREIDTNKRSEYIRRTADLKKAARHMPSKYKDMIKDKEKELKIK